MKQWNVPFVEELDMSATAYNPDGGNKTDGAYVSKDGRYTRNTFCTSSGNVGTPKLNGNDPSMGQRGDGVADNFIGYN